MTLPLSFLRPRALPLASTLNYFLRAASTAPSPSSTAAARPYRVALTKSKEFPVYHLNKRGGNMHLTRVKNIEGDIDAFKADLREVLGLEGEKDVVINQLTRHIIVKGHHREHIKQFLADNGVGFTEVVELL